MWAGSVYLIINDRLTLSGATEMLRRYLKRKTGKAVYKQHTLNGSQIISEQRDDKLLVFLYDESGSPIGMQYRTDSMSEGTFYTYLFEKNLQGDIIAVYNTSGTKLISYVYDAWGNFKQTNHNISGTNAGAQYNPFTYRGYYYDAELDFYYLQSRYYDPEYGRFINADGQLNPGLLGYNMYIYCNNNPIMGTDETGKGWLGAVIGGLSGAVVGGAFGAINALIHGDDVKTGAFLGAVNGGITGAIAGSVAQDIATGGISAVGTATLVVAVSSFATGAATDMVSQSINDDVGLADMDYGSVLQSGVETAIFATASVFLPGTGTIAGDAVITTVYNMMTSAFTMGVHAIQNSIEGRKNISEKPEEKVIPVY